MRIAEPADPVRNRLPGQSRGLDDQVVVAERGPLLEPHAEDPNRRRSRAVGRGGCAGCVAFEEVRHLREAPPVEFTEDPYLHHEWRTRCLAAEHPCGFRQGAFSRRLDRPELDVLLRPRILDPAPLPDHRVPARKGPGFRPACRRDNRSLGVPDPPQPLLPLGRVPALDRGAHDRFPFLKVHHSPWSRRRTISLATSSSSLAVRSTTTTSCIRRIQVSCRRAYCLWARFIARGLPFS